MGVVGFLVVFIKFSMSSQPVPQCVPNSTSLCRISLALSSTLVSIYKQPEEGDIQYNLVPRLVRH